MSFITGIFSSVFIKVGLAILDMVLSKIKDNVDAKKEFLKFVETLGERGVISAKLVKKYEDQKRQLGIE